MHLTSSHRANSVDLFKNWADVGLRWYILPDLLLSVTALGRGPKFNWIVTGRAVISTRTQKTQPELSADCSLREVKIKPPL